MGRVYDVRESIELVGNVRLYSSSGHKITGVIRVEFDEDTDYGMATVLAYVFDASGEPFRNPNESDAVKTTFRMFARVRHAPRPEAIDSLFRNHRKLKPECDSDPKFDVKFPAIEAKDMDFVKRDGVKNAVTVNIPNLASTDDVANIVASIDAARRKAMENGTVPKLDVQKPESPDIADDADPPHVVGG